MAIMYVADCMTVRTQEDTFKPLLNAYFLVILICVVSCNVQCRNCDFKQEADNQCIYVNKVTHEVE